MRSTSTSTRRFLGEGHPLTRVEASLATVRNQALVCLALVAASPAMLLAGRDAWVATVASAVLVEAGAGVALLGLRAVRRQRIHDMIVGGTVPDLEVVRAEVRRLRSEHHGGGWRAASRERSRTASAGTSSCPRRDPRWASATSRPCRCHPGHRVRSSRLRRFDPRHRARRAARGRGYWLGPLRGGSGLAGARAHEDPLRARSSPGPLCWRCARPRSGRLRGLRGRAEHQRLDGCVGQDPGEVLRREAGAVVGRRRRDDPVEPLDLPDALERVRRRSALLDPRVDGDAGRSAACSTASSSGIATWTSPCIGASSARLERAR